MVSLEVEMVSARALVISSSRSNRATLSCLCKGVKFETEVESAISRCNRLFGEERSFGLIILDITDVAVEDIRNLRRAAVNSFIVGWCSRDDMPEYIKAGMDEIRQLDNESLQNMHRQFVKELDLRKLMDIVHQKWNIMVVYDQATVGQSNTIRRMFNRLGCEAVIATTVSLEETPCSVVI